MKKITRLLYATSNSLFYVYRFGALRKIKLHFVFTLILFATFHTAKTQSINITGPTGSEQFGQYVYVLSNGNYVITDPYFDEGFTDIGAVYLYNGSTHALISTLKGSAMFDRVGLGTGSGGVTVLPNGNYVVRSNQWRNNRGAVTWCNGTTGISGVVSSSNSLVGSTDGDQVAESDITVLSNGNYVVSSRLWDNGALNAVGAVTWANGNIGISGTISSSISLVGSTANDQIGFGGVKALSNGNYVVSSYYWDNGATIDAGAVTWANGSTGLSGILSSSNSLVGSTANDQVSSHGLTVLNNGNYVVVSSYWDNGTIDGAGAVTWGNGSTGISGVVSSSNSLVGGASSYNVGSGGIYKLANGNYVVRSDNWFGNAGAVTWGNGSTGISGVVSSTNSLVGGSSGNLVGNGGIYELVNGNYIVRSYYWDNAAATDAGAVTWANGSTGRSGVVSSSNSMVGGTANNLVGLGDITILSNGNYVVNSSRWDNGAVTDAGAVTWGNGAIGVQGVVSSSNSLVGSKLNDRVGSNGVTALANGNYVVGSADWDNGAIIDVGAATWCNGSTGRVGSISNINSLVGGTANNRVAEGNIIALTNGNYVVSSRSWDNGVVLDVGAVTWANGVTGIVGTVSTINSLVGSVAYDNVGSGGIASLTNGNYVVGSPNWDNGTALNAGAATWGNGTTGIVGVLTSSNSLVGSTADNNVGNNFRTLSNGNFVIQSPNWDNGAVTNVGAATWGNGSIGTSGVVSSINSIIGSTANDQIGCCIAPLSNGNYTIWSPYRDNGVNADAGAMTLANATVAVAGIITNCNSVIGSAYNGGVNTRSYYNSVYDYLIVGRPGDNIVTIYNSTGMALANSLDVASVNIYGTNAVPLITSNTCRIIATLTPNGASAVNGLVNAKAWIEPSVPTHAGQPFVARHFEITPTTNTSTATGNVTLYFTQQEFTDFNGHANSLLDLPTDANDATGKANLRVGKYSGTTNNGTGLPASYVSGATVIDPADADIVWNSTLSRWEVSFNVTGFSGFIVQTNAFVLPLSLLEFKGKLINADALLNWKTDNEINTHSFNLERSTDGRNYTGVFTAPAFNTTGTHQYNFTDPNISSLNVAVVYYRLKQIDIDGRFTYSHIVALSPGNKNIVLLYPNPVQDKASLMITVNKTQQVQYRIIDNTGRIILEQKSNVTSGSNSLSIDVSNLASGMYWLEIKSESINERKQFIKQ